MTMDAYKYELRKRKRGIHCLINAGSYGRLCGCGFREPPTKAYKNRIIRRALAQQLRREIEQ